jgi:sensor histidine kinase YesM
VPPFKIDDMKKSSVSSVFVVSLIAAVIYGAVMLPSIVYLNHGQTDLNFVSLIFFVSETLISFFITYVLFNLFTTKWPTQKLELRLLLVFIVSTAIYIPVYLLYWIFIIRRLYYGIGTPVAWFFRQEFTAVTTLHIPVCFITLSLLYNKTLQGTQLKLVYAQKLLAERNLKKLQQQVHPHFLFNSLNILNALITTNPDRASEFTEKLASLYRELLQHQNNDIISLDEELKLMMDYYLLLCFRFEQSLYIDLKKQYTKSESDLLLIPFTLQFLIENIVKHNSLYINDPMHVNIIITDDQLTVKNKIKQKNQIKQLVGTGLQNLREQYLITSEKEIKFGEENGEYIVSVPFIKRIK